MNETTASERPIPHITAAQRDLVKEAKRDLEFTINAAIVRAVKAFEEKTGVQISSVDIDVVDVSTYSDPLPKYAMGRVTVSVEI